VIEDMPVEGRLIRAIIEDLQELRAAEMEHELRVEREVALEPEAGRVILTILCEATAEADKHAVDPAQHIWSIIDLALEDGNTAHKNSSGFLVESLSNSRISGRSTEWSSYCSHSKVILASGILIVCENLEHSALLASTHRWSPALTSDL
jgi:hypothetical protein